MRRYINVSNIKDNGLRFDLVIIGGGVAGLYAALNLSDNLSCCLITKESIDISNSWLAQGGIAAAISEGDLPQYHYDDTLLAGAGLVNTEAVKVLVEEGPKDIKTLLEWDVPFDLDGEGDLLITREGGHRRNRIVHAHGDGTGRETVKALARLVATKENIKFMPNKFLLDVVTDNNSVNGVIITDKDNREYIGTNQVILCTGGSGQIYEHTTNPGIATGDGVGASMRAGAKTKDMEFVQFHPTGLYIEGEKGRSFLISEAVRGEGGILRNINGEAFMDDKHELKDLAPRDIVARCIINEMKNTNSPFVYLDITSKSKAFLSKRFPTIYGECLNQGIDISKEYIPVCPVQHYMMGGIATDLFGRTNIQGLFACGEAANTGVHGANRLASNSMLECLVFSRRAISIINSISDKYSKEKLVMNLSEESQKNLLNLELDMSSLKDVIRELMTSYAGAIRHEKEMQLALDSIKKIYNTLEVVVLDTKEKAEVYNMSIVAMEILKSAINRKVSIGAHYRED
ncbi:MAG: L-aspartate oxidase [Firmicutes bacterium]|nr:L-aspartate oxidase [Bacillota bacterium]